MSVLGGRVDKRGREPRFRGVEGAKLGTPKRPLLLRVQNEARKEEVVATCKEKDWACEVTVDADQPEDIAQLERLLSPIETVQVEKETGRNDPCPCGSGKKYKQCHGKK